jgi:hypothetical protein
MKNINNADLIESFYLKMFHTTFIEARLRYFAYCDIYFTLCLLLRYQIRFLYHDYVSLRYKLSPKANYISAIETPGGNRILVNSLTCKLLQCFYLPTPKQYGEYVIEFKSFHQNGNISETVA